MSNRQNDYDQAQQNYNYSRQQTLTQQTSTNASQDFDFSQVNRMTQQKDVTQNFRDSIVQKAIHTQIKNEPQFYEFTEVFVWGDDRWGQLGLYHQKLKKGNCDQVFFKVPKTCSFNILIKQISCGDNHSAILTNQGHLYMMGSNSQGQLGIGDNCPDLQNKDCAGAPCLVDKLRDYKVESVECGSNFTFSIVKDSNNQEQSIFAWGCNREGQLGLSSLAEIDFPTKLKFFEDYNIRIKQISAGSSHSLFLTEESQVYAVGSNSSGQLGIGQQINQAIQPIIIDTLVDKVIIQISAGDHHSLFLTSTGEVYCCGNNQLNQLGIMDAQTNQYTPLKITALQNYKIVKIEAKQESAAISNAGELFLWGKGVFGSYRTPQKILTISNPVCDISLGRSLGTALDSKGLLWTWGTNEHGELGVGDQDPRIHPYPVLTLKGKKVTQIMCGGKFVVALGVNVKKEIPQLKLKKQKDSTQNGMNLQRDIRTSSIVVLNRNSSLNSIGKHQKSLSKTKKKNKNSSSSKILRRDSIDGLRKIYGGINAEKNNSNALSPKLNKESKLSKILKKKVSSSSLNKSKLQESIPRSQSKSRKIKIKKSSSKPKTSGIYSQPFSGDDTTIIKPGTFLNQSCLVVKKKNKLALSKNNHNHQIQTQISPRDSQYQLTYKNQSQQHEIFNVEINNASSQDMTQDSNTNITAYINSQHQSNHKSLMQQAVMYIPQPLQSSSHQNKEKLIKDLQTELKQLRTENELLKKENKTVKQQMDQLEKHYEKHNVQQQHQQEMQNLHAEIKRQELKIVNLKMEKKDYKNQYESQIQENSELLTQVSDLQKEKQCANDQIEGLRDQYEVLRENYIQAEAKNQEQENEMKEIQEEIMQISQQSNQVEKSLLDKLQEVSEKYQGSMKQIDEMKQQIKADKRRQEELAYTMKDTQFYVNALEKENSFLREEIEKAKYSKDKDQYGKFIQNLIPIKGKQRPVNDENDYEKTDLKMSSSKSPFRENFSKENSCIDKSACKYEELTQKHFEQPQILRASVFSQDSQQENLNFKQSQNENVSSQDFNDLRMSYNQKLLKSLEKKTLNKIR